MPSSSRVAPWFIACLASLAACGPIGELTPRDGAADAPRDGDSATTDDARAGDDGGGPNGGDASSDGAPTAACPAPDGTESGALAFDGVDDHVTMGAARALGLARFTVEAWVRRDGPGVGAGTGVGGLELVPIAGKGRGEDDGSNVDCNYAFGFYGEVLGADFEDMARGLNHPVVGRTPIRRGEWHHVAASYDGTTWRLYVDGRLDAQAAANAAPRADSIQHFGLGTFLNSTGAPAGRLHGALDEVRVWNYARTQAEIAGAMYRTVPGGGAGLVGRWALDADARDTGGMAHGMAAGGARFVRPGAGLDRGAPPTVAMPAPRSGEMVTGTSVELGVEVRDPDSAAFTTTFHLRELSDRDDFTVVVLPDTQYYTVQGNGFERYFYDQTRWIMANRAMYNIVAVIHNGDITDHGDRYEYEWTVADRAMRTLEAPAAGLPDGVPYGVAVGNHDQTPFATPGQTASFNRFFGVNRFASRAYYGGHYGSTNDDNWFTFTAGGLDFVVVSLQYDTMQDPAVLAWTRGVFAAHPGAFGIVNSHFIVGSDGMFGAQGAAIYNGVRAVPNVRLMTNGHVSAEARRSDTHEGRVIHSMLADYQGRANGGSGWMRIWEFSPANNELTVRTYSPTLDRWEMDANSEFTLPVDLAGSGGAFRVAATVDPAGAGMVRATVTGLTPGRTYEWYASVTDCAHTVLSGLSRFRTQ